MLWPAELRRRRRPGLARFGLFPPANPRSLRRAHKPLEPEPERRERELLGDVELERRAGLLAALDGRAKDPLVGLPRSAAKAPEAVDTEDRTFRPRREAAEIAQHERRERQAEVEDAGAGAAPVALGGLLDCLLYTSDAADE